MLDSLRMTCKTNSDVRGSCDAGGGRVRVRIVARDASSVVYHSNPHYRL